MQRHGPFLCVDACPQHGCGAEEYTYLSVAHVSYHGLAGRFTLCLLNEAYFMGRYAVVLRQFTLYFAVNAPLAGLVRSQVAEDELYPPLLPVVLPVVPGNIGINGNI